SVYMADCVDGFGGGNVAASIGPDGILLVDDMYAAMAPKLQAALAKISPLPKSPCRRTRSPNWMASRGQADRPCGPTGGPSRTAAWHAKVGIPFQLGEPCPCSFVCFFVPC
ncbi:MAG: hypothetical protein V4567_13130, partial [Pseudomonadota bacterium]